MKYATVVVLNRFIRDGPTDFEVFKRTVLVCAHHQAEIHGIGRKYGGELSAWCRIRHKTLFSHIFALIDADQITALKYKIMSEYQIPGSISVFEINRDYGMFNRSQAPNFYT